MDPILVISEEPALAETLAGEIAQCAIVTARSGEAATVILKDKFCLILTDIDLAGDDGTLSTLLATSKVPVIKLSRPVRLPDLLYTIRERLQSKTAPAREDVEGLPGYRLSSAERLLTSDDGATSIALTEKEVEVLLCLMEQAGSPIPREKLLKHVWGYSDDIATHTLETHIYRLRGKLRQANESFDIIFSEEGGYILHT